MRRSDVQRIARLHGDVAMQRWGNLPSGVEQLVRQLRLRKRQRVRDVVLGRWKLPRECMVPHE